METQHHALSSINKILLVTPTPNISESLHTDMSSNCYLILEHYWHFSSLCQAYEK